MEGDGDLMFAFRTCCVAASDWPCSFGLVVWLLGGVVTSKSGFFADHRVDLAIHQNESRFAYSVLSEVPSIKSFGSCPCDVLSWQANGGPSVGSSAKEFGDADAVLSCLGEVFVRLDSYPFGRNRGIGCVSLPWAQ